MTVFDQQRLTQTTLQLDIAGIRRGEYSDKYFENVVCVLSAAEQEQYRYRGAFPFALPVQTQGVAIGDLVVEAQIFTRHAPTTLIAGVDAALAMIRHATGVWQGDHFQETWQHLEVHAVYDGALVPYDGHPESVLPVIHIRGRYRDFALLETTMLGVLSRASRIATAVYEVLQVSRGKPILFFPARFDVPEAQVVDGYAYWLAVQAYNHESGQHTVASVSTDAQARWWGGHGGGTVPHSLIAAFFGDTAEAMVQFARHSPLEVPRIVLADFSNDVVTDTLRTLDVYWQHYQPALAASDAEGMRRWMLDGVRLDTGANMRDVSMGEEGPRGVNAVLVRVLRAAIDSAWQRWGLAEDEQTAAIAYCRSVKIAVTGGFNRERIAQFEADGTPVDVYGVGSSLLRNDAASNTDFTMDVVRVQVDGQWVDLAKVGRRANDNPDLRPVDLSLL